MSTFYKLVKTNGYVKIDVDETSRSPREEISHDTKFYVFAKKYVSPDKHNYSSFADFLSEADLSISKSFENDLEHLNKAYPDKYFFPVSINEGLNHEYSISANNPIGLIFMEKADLEQYGGCSFHTLASSEIETYNKWVNNEVYMFTEYDSLGEEVNSCGGFYDANLEENGMMEYLSPGNLIPLGEFSNIGDCMYSTLKENGKPFLENLIDIAKQQEQKQKCEAAFEDAGVGITAEKRGLELPLSERVAHAVKESAEQSSKLPAKDKAGKDKEER